MTVSDCRSGGDNRVEPTSVGHVRRSAEYKGAVLVARMTRPASGSKLSNPRGRHRKNHFSPFRRIHELIAESFFRNSAFLLLNLILGSGCGFVALMLLTHLYSVQAVGLSATAVSASALVVFIMQFGITYTLPRFLPTSPHRTALINTSLTAIIVSTMIASIVFLTLPFADKLFALGGWLFCIVFVLGTCFQAGDTVFGVVLVADRSSSKLVTANTIPNIIRLAAPVCFLLLGSLGAYLARIIPDVIGFIILGAVIAKRGHHFRPTLSITATRGLGRFSAGMYVANIIGGLPQLLVPIIVLARFGAKQSAYWSIAIAIASLLYSLPATVTQALLPEVAYRPSERRFLIRRSTILIVTLVLPALIVAYIASPMVLRLFGSNYVAESLTPLRWLIFAGFITMLNYITGTILILAKKSFMITIVNAVDAIIVLGLTSAWAIGARGVAISWTLGDVANTLLFAIFAIFALREVGGRWEHLGDKQADLAAQTPQVPAINAQLQGLQVLLMLAERQRGAPIHDSPASRVTPSSNDGMDLVRSAGQGQGDQRDRPSAVFSDLDRRLASPPPTGSPASTHR